MSAKCFLPCDFRRVILGMTVFLSAFSVAFCGMSVCGNAQDARSVGFLVDQPWGVPAELETSFPIEIAGRMDGVNVTMLYPAERTLKATVNENTPATYPAGTACRYDGKAVMLADFPVLWIHQGEEADAVGPLYTEAWGKTLREYAESDTPRVVLLTGGAPRLLKTAGIVNVESAPVPVMNDRYQVGLIPYGDTQAENSLWRGLTRDRGTFWFTNAVYASLQYCKLQQLPAENAPEKSVTTEILNVARVPGGPSIPLIAVRHGNCVFFVLSWNFSQLYNHAAVEFRQNTETFLKNILLWKNTSENVRALTVAEPEKKVYPVKPLRDMMADYQAKKGKEYPGFQAFSERLAVFENAMNAENGNAVASENTVNATVSGSAVNQESFDALKREIMLAHPELDFDRVLFIKRKGAGLALPHNYNSNSVLAKTGYGNTLCELNLRTGAQRTVYTPPKDFWIGDLELHFDAEKVMFSMPSAEMSDPRWRLWEVGINPEQNAEQGGEQNAENAQNAG
ncbi:MAG: hypothetical protein Q4C70_08145, partial [Planctomycetia bacterium]|nr:hypothetical protein [Planctomycetia bacterium]